VTVIPTLIGVVIVTFLLTRVLPGDPAVYFAGPAATPQSIAEIRKSLGLDRPLPEQFAATSTISPTAISAIRCPPAAGRH
jgi:ABC-type dipeptide/oligopeptide/nickel transport system permease component